MINRGVAPTYVSEGGLRVVNQKCIRDHVIDYRLARRHDARAKTVSADRLIRVGDVLVNSTGTGTLGRVAQVRSEPDEATTVDTHVTIVRPKTSLFHLDFFGYAMRAIENEIAASGEGTSGQTELARSTLHDDFTVTFPASIAEQQRVVAILDEAFEAIAAAATNAHSVLVKTSILFNSVRDTVLRNGKDHWLNAQLHDLITIKHGYAFESDHFRDDGEFVLLTPGNFFESGGFRDRGSAQKRYSGPVPDGFILPSGSFLVAMTEQAAGLLGSPIILPAGGPYLHNQRLGLVKARPTSPWHDRFFFHVQFI